MPEYTQLTPVKLSCSISFHCFVHTKILMITGKYLSCISSRMVIKDKVLKQIKEVSFFTDTAQHCFKSYAPRFFFRKTFPFMEKLKLTSQSAHFCFHAIREHKKSIVVKQMRNSILIVGVIIIICILHVNSILFKFYKK